GGGQRGGKASNRVVLEGDQTVWGPLGLGAVSGLPLPRRATPEPNAPGPTAAAPAGPRRPERFLFAAAPPPASLARAASSGDSGMTSNPLRRRTAISWRSRGPGRGERITVVVSFDILRPSSRSTGPRSDVGSFGIRASAANTAPSCPFTDDGGIRSGPRP